MKRVIAIVAALQLLAAGARANCPGADPNDDQPDDAALQACLNRGGTVNLVPGLPGYIIALGLRIAKNGTRLTAQPSVETPARASLTQGWKASVVAHPELTGSLLKAGGKMKNYEVSNIVFDGNLGKRTRLDLCSDGSGLGPNLVFEGSRFRIHDIASVRALCGSAMLVLGSRFEIFGNTIFDNGRSGDKASGIPAPWADGMTVLLCDHGAIYDNHFEDNTDIGLVVGGGPNCNVRRNTIVNERKHAFAGLNVGNFNDNGNHSGSVYAENRISARKNMLIWGLQLGSHPWSVDTQVSDAGSVFDNRISGAMVNLHVDGVGKGRLYGNVFSNPQGTYGYGCPDAAGGDCCRTPVDYAAADFGQLDLQPGYVSRVFHHGQCPDVPDPRQPPELPEPEPSPIAPDTGQVPPSGPPPQQTVDPI